LVAPFCSPRLSGHTELIFLGWTAIGLVVYFLYSKDRSNMTTGKI